MSSQKIKLSIFNSTYFNPATLQKADMVMMILRLLLMIQMLTQLPKLLKHLQQQLPSKMETQLRLKS